MAPPGSSTPVLLEWPQERVFMRRGKKVSLAAFQDKAKGKDFFFFLCELIFFLYIAIPCYTSGSISVFSINLFV